MYVIVEWRIILIGVGERLTNRVEIFGWSVEECCCGLLFFECFLYVYVVCFCLFLFE